MAESPNKRRITGKTGVGTTPPPPNVNSDFFAQIDTLGVAEQHLDKISRLNESQSKILIARYKEIRQELRDRLDHMRGDTFSAQQMRSVIVQVESAIEAMNRGLIRDMTNSAKVFSLRGVEDVLEESARYESEFNGASVPININAVLIADDVANIAASRYESSIEAYGADIGQILSRQIGMAVIEEIPVSEFVRRLSGFVQAEEWKLWRLARTELHGVYNLGKLGGMKELGAEVLPDLQKTLYHPMDSRTGEDSKFVARKDLIVDLNKPFKYKWGGKERVFMVPPDRPNDRAILIPYRPSWGL